MTSLARWTHLIFVLLAAPAALPADAAPIDADAGVKPNAPWAEIVGKSESVIPAAPASGEKVSWLSDFPSALAKAKQLNKPMFVTLRCLPCKQCSAFDKNVLEGGPDLDPLLKQFVTVRLISAKDVDLRVMQMADFQDMDLSWWGYFLSPDGRIYGIFGGRDEVSDATRISVPALANTLKRVLSFHYDPRRTGWEKAFGIDGDIPRQNDVPKTPTQLPGFVSWSTGRTFDKQTTAASCLHCHQVSEVLRQPAIDAGKFDKDRNLQIWPLPENVGITLERDDGLLVTAIAEGSPAAAAGLKPGDSLAAAGASGDPQGRRLFGQADFRGVLHRGPAAEGTIDLWWLRDGKPMNGQLKVQDGWRKTVLDWRTSVAGGNVGAMPGFFPIPVTPQDRKARGIPDKSMAIKPAINDKVKTPAVAAGLKATHVITAVNDQRPDLSGRSFMVWFRMHYDNGAKVTLTVKDEAGKEQKIAYTAGPRGE